MINAPNGMIFPSPSATAQSPGLKTYFKTPVKVATSFGTRSHILPPSFTMPTAKPSLRPCKARQATIPKDKNDKQQKDKLLPLTMEDLSKALREYGVNVRHQEYFADSPLAGMDHPQ